MNAPATLLPHFSQIRAEDIGPAIDSVIADNLRTLSRVLIEQQDAPTWAGVAVPLEDMNQRLQAVLAPIAQIAGETEEVDIVLAHDLAQQQVLLYQTALAQNETLFGVLQKLQHSPQAAHFSPVQHYALAFALRDARLAGGGYAPALRDRVQTLTLELDTLYTRFRRNLRAAHASWSRDFVDEAALDGLSAVDKQAMADLAAAEGVSGWTLRLDAPRVRSILSHAHDRALRETVYHAFYTQASDQSPVVGSNDNGPVMTRILAARLELANLLGHRSYAQRAMATRMFDDPDDVEAMLLQLLAKVRPAAESELDVLRAFARGEGIADLQAWDLDYYRERYRQAHFDVAEAVVRDYFPLPAVLAGLGALVERLFDVQMVERADADTWHADVRVFELRESGEALGYIYFDLFDRPAKGPGIFMQGLRERHRFTGGRLQLPIAQLSCDFIQTSTDPVACLSLKQVTDLMHEFGHTLHHVLTRVEHASVAGLNGVADDVIEFPSSLFEHWPTDVEVLSLLSAHRLTGEPVPAEFLDRVLAAQRAFQALELLFQLEYALLDLRLHQQTDTPVLMPVVEQVLAEVEVLRTPPTLRYVHSFGHLFATGDYASGYYTYVWSRVLAAETFARFAREGVLSAEVGAQLRESILAPGGTLPINEMLERFNGRQPQLGPLLASLGID